MENQNVKRLTCHFRTHLRNLETTQNLIGRFGQRRKGRENNRLKHEALTCGKHNKSQPSSTNMPMAPRSIMTIHFRTHMINENDSDSSYLEVHFGISFQNVH